jgi:hypothetical protein
MPVARYGVVRPIRGRKYSTLTLELSAFKWPSARRYPTSVSMLNVELTGKEMTAPIGVELRESSETKGVTSIAGGVGWSGAGATGASCACAGDAASANAHTTMIGLANLGVFISGSFAFSA